MCAEAKKKKTSLNDEAAIRTTTAGMKTRVSGGRGFHQHQGFNPQRSKTQ